MYAYFEYILTISYLYFMFAISLNLLVVCDLGLLFSRSHEETNMYQKSELTYPSRQSARSSLGNQRSKEWSREVSENVV